MGDSEPPPRWLPTRPLPPYSYVSGYFPHPRRNPAGHQFGALPVAVPPPDAARWTECHEYLYGIDLFNAGYYWEAHESWESVWLALGREGALADLLKGLIKLAAAGVKAREGNATGVRRHARRAKELFARTADKIGDSRRLAGLSLLDLRKLADRFAGEIADGIVGPEPLLRFSQYLRPSDSG